MNGCNIPVYSVRNLGATLDKNPLFPATHIYHLCQACYLELRWISSIHHYFTHDALKTLICNFVPSRTDYCNSLLAGCPQNLICKLQNNAAHLIRCSVRSIMLYTGFLSNPTFSTKWLFLPLNRWTTKPLPISLISSRCMFSLANSIRLLTLDSFIFSFCSPKVFWLSGLLLSSTISLEQSTLLTLTLFFCSII